MMVLFSREYGVRGLGEGEDEMRLSSSGAFQVKSYYNALRNHLFLGKQFGKRRR